VPISWWKRRKARQVTAALGEGDRFCKDCRWCRPRVDFFIFRRYEFAKCASPKWRKFEIAKKDQARYYVDELLPVPKSSEENYCTIMRQDNLEYCGSKGDGWEPK
jgi:hypothetical protein